MYPHTCFKASTGHVLLCLCVSANVCVSAYLGCYCCSTHPYCWWTYCVFPFIRLPSHISVVVIVYIFVVVIFIHDATISANGKESVAKWNSSFSNDKRIVQSEVRVSVLQIDRFEIGAYYVKWKDDIETKRIQPPITVNWSTPWVRENGGRGKGR